MRRMDLNHWFIDDDELSIALMRWHVTIKPRNYDVELIIHYDSQIVSTLRFKNYEEAVAFTEQVINKYYELEEIETAYHEMYKDKPKVRSKRKSKNEA